MIKQLTWITLVCLMLVAAPLASQNVSYRQFPNDRITNGTEAEIGSYPFVASIEIDGLRTCGGVFLSPKTSGSAVVGFEQQKDPVWLLTAAHCFHTVIGNIGRGEFSQIKVFSSVHDLSEVGRITSSEDADKLVPAVQLVKAVYLHEKYSENDRTYDLALVQLEPGEERRAAHRHSISFPKLSEHPWVVAPYTQSVVAGWGKTKARGYESDVLLKAVLPIVENGFCNSILAQKGFNLPLGTICAGWLSPNGSDACIGDSGGPLFFDPSGVNPGQGSYNIPGPILLGIVSWGYGCSEPTSPGVYTSAFAYRNWIMSKISKTQ